MITGPSKPVLCKLSLKIVIALNYFNLSFVYIGFFTFSSLSSFYAAEPDGGASGRCNPRSAEPCGRSDARATPAASDARDPLQRPHGKHAALSRHRDAAQPRRIAHGE